MFLDTDSLSTVPDVLFCKFLSWIRKHAFLVPVKFVSVSEFWDLTNFGLNSFVDLYSVFPSGIWRKFLILLDDKLLIWILILFAVKHFVIDFYWILVLSTFLLIIPKSNSKSMLIL